MFNNLKINYKIALIFIVLIVFLISFVATALYYNFSNILQNQLIKDLNQVMVQHQINLENMINSIDQMTLFLYTNKYMLDIFSKPDISEIEAKNASNIINLQLTALPLNMYSSYYTVTFFVDSNIPLSQKLTPTSSFYYGLFNNTLVHSQPWYQKALNSDGALIWFTDKDKNNGGTTYFCFARLIKCPLLYTPDITGQLSGTDLGIVVIRFDISNIVATLQDSNLTSNTLIHLTDESGSILLSREAPSGEAKDSLSALLPSVVKDGRNNFSLTYNNQQYIVNVLSLHMGWRLVSMVPVKDIKQQMAQLNTIIGFTLLLAIVGGIVFSIILSNQISLPIRKLSKIMHKINSEQTLHPIAAPSTNDEVGLLYRNFNDMIHRIRKLLDDIHSSNEREKDAEMKVLISQINPHFLYNTLDSISWLALSVGAKQICDMNNSLCELLRYSIKNPKELVSVGEEIQKTQNFIDIRAMCYNHSFDVTIDLSPEILASYTPKLILQPIIENAILHGISQVNRRGSISISGCIDEDFLILSICDNGRGTDVAKLNSELDMEITSNFGVRNVHQRIKTLFGERYGLQYFANETHGITAVIQLPPMKKPVSA